MRALFKLILMLFLIVLLGTTGGFFALRKSQTTLQESIGQNSAVIAQQALDKIDQLIYFRLEEVSLYFEDLFLKRMLQKENDAFSKIEKKQDYILENDKAWASEKKETITPFMEKIINTPLSQNLRVLLDFQKERYGYPVFGEIIVTNKYGVNIAQTDKTSDYYQADEQWWTQAKEEGSYVSDIGYDESSGFFSIDLCVRISDENGNFLGIIKAVENLEGVGQIIEESKKNIKSKSLGVELVSKEGRIIYNNAKKFLGENSLHPLDSIFGHAEGKQHVLWEVKEDSVDHKVKLFAHAHSRGYRKFKGLGWVLIMEYDAKEIFLPIKELRDTLLKAAFVVLALVVGVGLFMFLPLVRAISKMKAATAQIGKGNLGVKIDIDPKGEIGELAQSFNQMVVDLKGVTVSRDDLQKEIEQRKKAQEDFYQSEKRFMDVLHSAQDAILLIDSEKFVDANEATARMLGYSTREDFLMTHPSELSPPNQPDGQKSFEKANEMMRIAFESGFHRFEWTHRKKTGEDFPLEVSLTPVSYKGKTLLHCLWRDLTEEKKSEKELARANKELYDSERALKNMLRDMQETNKELREAQDQLLQSEKMAAVGQLSAGVAHQVKNPLAIILLSADLIKDEEKGFSEETKKHFDLIVDAANRANRVVKELLEFARSSEEKRSDVDIHKSLDGVIFMVKQSCKNKEIEFVSQYANERILIKGNDILIGQVVFNIISNAVDSIEESGTIMIKTKISEQKAVVEISDTGSGISEQAQKRIFDPFFTTKEQGKGTGLGLSTAYKIMERHSGEISVKSEIGKGTTFFVTFPLGARV